jgi:cytochrome P450
MKLRPALYKLLYCYSQLIRILNRRCKLRLTAYGHPNTLVKTYHGDYPKMRTIMAVMLEALRLFPVVALIPKVTNGPQTLKMGDYEIHVPPSTTVRIDSIGLHRNTKYWGPVPHEFCPARWLMAPGYTQPKDTVNKSTAHPDLLCL